MSETALTFKGCMKAYLTHRSEKANNLALRKARVRVGLGRVEF